MAVVSMGDEHLVKAQQIYLKILDEINGLEDEIKHLKQRATDIQTVWGERIIPESGHVGRSRRVMSPEARGKISRATKQRWARHKGGNHSGNLNFTKGDWKEDEIKSLVSFVKSSGPLPVREVARRLTLKGRTPGAIAQRIMKMKDTFRLRKNNGKITAEVVA